MLTVLMAVLVVVFTALVRSILDKSNAMDKKVARSLQITGRLKDVLSTLADAEAGERGYIITGDENFLKPYFADIEKNAGVINPYSLLAFMPEYSGKITLLNGLIKEKIAHVNNIVATIKAGGQQKAFEITKTGRGRLVMDSIRTVINGMLAGEETKINNAYAEESKDTSEFFALLLINAACCLLLLFVFYKMVLRNAALREKTEADLLAAKNLAETANKAKTNFLTLMSHEIRTPMHDIIATSALLSDTGVNSEQQTLTNTIYRGSMALLSVVNDIIDFSRIETGTLPVENTPFVLKDCLDEVFSAAGPSPFLERRLYYIDENIPKLIECDPARLRQVLFSLLSNSSKAIENGEIGLSVRLISQEGNQLYIRFTIMNTGTVIFNSRIHDGSDGAEKDEDETDEDNRLFGISSLRFSIAARLISLMGGTMKLTDKGDKGSTIAFTIKARKADVQSSELFFAERIRTGLPDNKMAITTPLNILVADDYEMNQALLVQILAKMGYTCKTAVNGAEAAGMAIETNFDIIFMDIVMPVMDGIEATRRIREYYVNSDAPIIIGVTAHAFMNENKSGTEAGMNDFLIKPYKPSDVYAILAKWAPVVAPA